VMVAANLSAAGASFRLDLSRWAGERTREVLWGCDFPPADADWFVYLAAHGFSWWLIGEVEETDTSEDFGVQEDKLSPGVLGSPTPASSRRD
jgi:maltose alpha-D-glucosyltransferase/alpha-amylase